eukprot:2256-Heterococcus_DN1.PRE.2
MCDHYTHFQSLIKRACAYARSSQVILEKGMPKTERTGNPIFAVIIETSRASFNEWIVIHDVATAVDSLLLGYSFEAERRKRMSERSYNKKRVEYSP